MKAAHAVQALASDEDDDEEGPPTMIQGLSEPSPPSGMHGAPSPEPFGALPQEQQQTPMLKTDNMSKSEFHNKQRSKRRRQKQRGIHEELGKATMKVRRIKDIAIKRRKAAALSAITARLTEDGAHALKDDSPTLPHERAVPIDTSLSLDVDDVEVARTGFIGRLHKQTPADRV
ncbi:hypothetical protein FKP32DRAFT_1682508, partial [Trametes sanguinea]